MLVEVMESQHVLEAIRTFPSPVVLNGGFILQPGPRYLVLRFVHEYEDIQVSVLGYKEFGGYINFYDPVRSLPIIGDRLISLVNIAGSAFIQGRESAPRTNTTALAGPQTPISDTAVPLHLPDDSQSLNPAAIATATALAQDDIETDDHLDDSSLDDLFAPTEPDDISNIPEEPEEEEAPEPFDIPDDDIVSDLPVVTDNDDESHDTTSKDSENDQEEEEKADSDTETNPQGDDASDNEPLSQDSIDDLFG